MMTHHHRSSEPAAEFGAYHRECGRTKWHATGIRARHPQAIGEKGFEGPGTRGRARRLSKRKLIR